jgi:F-type H+-transporting ATPase subunit alpha
MAIEEQVCVIFAGVRGFLDKMVTSDISKFEQKFLVHLKSNYPKLLDRIRSSGKLEPSDETELNSILETFIPESGCVMKA